MEEFNKGFLPGVVHLVLKHLLQGSHVLLAKFAAFRITFLVSVINH